MGEQVVKSIKFSIDEEIWEELRVLGLRQKKTVSEVVSSILVKEVKKLMKKGDL